MTNIEKAISRLEHRVLRIEQQLKMDSTPRQQAERISQGIDAPHHIGDKSREVLIQEIYSLINTKGAFRPSDYDAQVLSRWHDLSLIVGDAEADKAVSRLYDYIREKEQHIAEQIKVRSGD